MKKFAMSLVAVAAIAVFGASSAFAQSGSQGLSDIGSPKAGGSTTGNINTATTFHIGNLLTTGASAGDFTGLPTTFIGSVDFDKTIGTSFSWTNAVFGDFTSSSITEITNTPGTEAFYIVGTYAPGSFAGTAGDAGAASFTLSFTQTPSGSGSISDSGTFSVPPSPPMVPEPSTFALLGLGALGLAVRAYRRRQAAV